MLRVEDMNQKQINQEFKKVTNELIYNKPEVLPYPPEIVRRRELLLFAEVHLCNILDAKKKKHKIRELFETELYQIVMKCYYVWSS